MAPLSRRQKGMSVNKNEGLKQKYIVTRVDGRPLKGGCIVLEFGDTNSRPAILQFASTVRANGYSKLADDLEAEIERLEKGGGGERE